AWPSRAVAQPVTERPSRSSAAPGRTAPADVIPAIGGDPVRLAGQLTSAEAVLSAGGASGVVLDRQALVVQLACLRVAAHPGWAGRVIARVSPAQRAAAAADIAATA